jgi:hypothetical protein
MTTCNCLQNIVDDGYEHPFFLARAISLLSGAVTKGWAVQIAQLTPTGRVSKTRRKTVYLNYCPLCGKRLQPEEVVTANGNCAN